MTLYQFVVNNFAALLLGALIGFERQWRQRTAGRQDTLMEKVVGLLSLEQAVSAASWKHIPQQLDE